MENELKTHLLELEQSHLQPDIRSDSNKLAQILSDDFFEFGSSGRLTNKELCLQGELNLDDMTLYNYSIDQLAPDVVFATYYLINHTQNRKTLRSSIWKYIDNRWQLSFHQGTITNKSLEQLK
ncbi:DUF4440 domain-containing protein [Gracilibacillus sp. S3-1-1]|uniref:DUF4440 domain-containing protein n=1 Tax=Gracilibacillus pellucidus TaxID=3095368 RepID=A0ACC6M8N4_9BACI|nr:DUF4440 domain-containing protein [Gracilibacillus sp. S3-1-1]MDX8047325.1 DUF4440 domain-containing protein [Gracilibacillus sp. S3-1-1]